MRPRWNVRDMFASIGRGRNQRGGRRCGHYGRPAARISFVAFPQTNCQPMKRQNITERILPRTRPQPKPTADGISFEWLRPSGMLRLCDIVGNQLISQTYAGYTRAESLALFREYRREYKRALRSVLKP